MIGFFPTPLPDELWYSVCARYGRIVNYSKEKLSSELWGRKNARLSIDLPSSLEFIAANLPPGNIFTAERIISHHTLLPYFAPFLYTKTVNKIIHLMKNKNGSTIHSIARISSSPIPIHLYLRYCPACFKEDEKNYGTAYWHRLHQVPGVMVCPEHECFLEDSAAKVVFQKNKIELFCAADYASESPVRKINTALKLDSSYLMIAEHTRWLLNRNDLQSQTAILRTKYYELLEKNSFYSPQSGIKVKQLINHLNNYYPAKFLRSLRSECIRDDRNNWIYKLSTYFRLEERLIPIRHLILMHALDQTPEVFFSTSRKKAAVVKCTAEKEFVDGPYPCLNPVCADYRKCSIKEFEIQPDTNSKNNFIVITCRCGFKYRRRGKDCVPEDIFRLTWIIDFGEVWKNELKKLWENKEKTLRQISKTLRMKSDTVKWMAAKMGLKFPRKITGGTSVDLTADIQRRLDKESNKEQIERDKFIQAREFKRELWLRIVKSHPEAGMSEIRSKIAPALVQWLYEKDREWLNENKPDKKIANKNVNWFERDVLGVEIVKKAVEALKNCGGRPEWIRKYSISRYFEKPNWLVHTKYSKKMPKTMKLLDEVVESRLEYNLRKIRWAIDEIKRECGSPRAYLIAEKAHVHANFRDVPQIKEALESGEREIEEAVLNVDYGNET